MPTASKRTAQLASIHIAKAQAQLSDSDYRALLRQLYGKDSSAHLSAAQRAQFVAHLQKLTPTQRAPSLPKPKRNPFELSDNPQHRKIYAQWAELGRLGALHQPGTKSLHALIKAQFELDHLRFLGVQQSRQLIEQLKAWIERSQDKSRV